MSKYSKSALQLLDNVIDQISSNINDFTKSQKDFTRNRKLNAPATLNTILNMQGNSINAELLDAFPDIDTRMAVSIYLSCLKWSKSLQNFYI